MSQPIAYSPAYNFTSFQTASPSTPLPADKLDTELQALKITTDSVRVNMALLQADDGTLKAQVVTPPSLSAATLALLTSVGVPRGAWVTATAYAAKDVVSQGAGTYICVTAHSSGAFATDLAAVKWILLAGSAGSIAMSGLSDVTLTSLLSDQLLKYNGSAWVNGLIAAANVTDATLTFAKLASSAYITSASLAGASNTNLPTSSAVKSYVDAQVTRGTASPIASATTTSLTGNTFDFAHITGTTTITGVTLATDEECWVVFDGALTLTHNAVTLILPGSANITTAAGDRALFRGIDGSNVRCMDYVRAAGTTGVPVLILSQTASSSASIDFTSAIDGTYKHYRIEISNLTAATSSALLWARVRQSGAFVTAANYSYGAHTTNTGGTTTAYGTTGQSKIIMNQTGCDQTVPASCIVDIFRPDVAANSIGVMWHYSSARDSTAAEYAAGTGAYNAGAGTATTGIRFLMSTGNIATGDFRLYGIP